MAKLNPLEVLFDIGPIIQAPMAGVSTPQLAAAVSNAGGLGSIGIGASTTIQARQMIAATRKLTTKPFNVNVFCHSPAQRNGATEKAWLKHLAPLFKELDGAEPALLEEIYKTFLEDDEAFEMILEEKPAVVSFHFGVPPTDKIKKMKRAGIYTLATATNLQEARLIEESEVDAIIAQGIEAGGHRGMFDPKAPDERLSTLVLVRILANRTQLPIIASGGIMDGKGIKAATESGAVAAQLGTAFILCPESAANDSYRDMLKGERAANTQLTTVISGRPARGIVNRLITHGTAHGAPAVADYPVAYDAAKHLNALAARQSNSEYAAHWAGQGAPLIRELPAFDLTKQLIQEWQNSD